MITRRKVEVHWLVGSAEKKSEQKERCAPVMRKWVKISLATALFATVFYVASIASVGGGYEKWMPSSLSLPSLASLPSLFFDVNLLNNVNKTEPEVQELVQSLQSDLQALLLRKDRSTFSIPDWPYDKEFYDSWVKKQNNCNYTMSFSMDLAGGTRAHICFFVAVYHAYLLNRTLVYWPLSTTLNLQDFLLPLPGNCKTPYPTGEPKFRDYMDQHILRNDSRPNLPHVWSEGADCAGEVFAPHEIKHKMADIVWRLKPDVKIKVENLLAAFHNWNKRTFYAIHIRRGDKVVGPAKEGEYIKTERYCKVLEEKVGGEVKDPVFVAADSMQTIEEVLNVRPNWVVWYVQDKDLQKMRAGEFVHAHVTNAPMETRFKWQLLFQAELTMMKFAKIFVGARHTNVAKLVATLREPIGTVIFQT